MSDEEQTQSSPLGAVVPQAFYDVIGRLIPGFILLWIGGWDASEPATRSYSWLGATATLVCSYLVGLCLSPAGNVAHWVVATILVGKPASWCHPMTSATEVVRRSDAVARRSARAGAVLAKMRAEATLFNNLTVGYAVLIIAHDVDPARAPLLANQPIWLQLLVIFGLAGIAALRTFALITRQTVFLATYGDR